MNSRIWTDQMALGHSALDSQHQNLVDLVEDVMRLSAGPRANAGFTSLVDELIAMSADHTLAEERFLTSLPQAIYQPHINRHRAHHDALHLSMADLRTYLTAQEAQEEIKSLVSKIFRGVLTDILELDSALVGALIQEGKHDPSE